MNRISIFSTNFIACIVIILCDTITSEILRPRGVSISRASLYNPDKNFFTCFDGTLTIPFAQVNDDYCDCEDGSDEPGTSACPRGIFHCTNAGHKPLNIASSRVNDGICDCCDGTDEYSHKNSNCINNCKELGRTAREAAQRRAELLKAGKQLRHEMSEKGLVKKQQMKDKLEDLKKNRIEAEKVLKEKEEIKKKAEDLENVALEFYRDLEEKERKEKARIEEENRRKEALDIFMKFDSNGDGKLEILELQTRQNFDRDRNGEVSEEEAKYFLNEKESVDQEEFVSESWTRIKPVMMIESGMFKPPSKEAEAEEETQSEQEEFPEGEEDLDEDLDQEPDQEPEEEFPQEDKQEEDSTPEPQKYDENTQNLINQANSARDEFSTAEQSVRNIQNEMNQIEEYLAKDFGPDEEFATLEGHCFEYTDYEYIYRLCPFDKAMQQAKSGHSDTRLGSWSRWSGPEDDLYSMMLYDKGQSCWNGPQRSTQVHVSCGSENKIISVSEPNRCEYLFDFITPAACREASEDRNEDLHDEL